MYRESLGQLSMRTYKSTAEFTKYAALQLSFTDLDAMTVPYTALEDTTFKEGYPEFVWSADGVLFLSNPGTSSETHPAYFTMTVTGKTNDIIEGTFHGRIRTEDNADVVSELTNGSFRVKVSRQ